MEDYIRQLLTQELQGGDGGEDVESGGNPTISPESKIGVGIASLINAIVGAKAMKGSGNAGLGALYGGASTYGEGMGNLQKAAAQAQTNKSKEERIKSLIKNQIFKQNFDTVKYLEKRKAEEAKAKKEALAAQNYGILLDPSNFAGMTPDEERVARSHVLSTMAEQDPGLAQNIGKQGKPNLKPFYRIDNKGNVMGNITWLNEDDPATLKIVQSGNLVPSNDPRIVGNRQITNINATIAGEGPKQWSRETMKNWAKDYENSQKEGLGAQTNLARIQQMKTSLGRGYQGKLASLKSTMGAYYESITGQPVAKAQETQIAQAIANRIALTMVGAQVEGGGMPANLFSEADREFVVQANTNPNLTPQANARLLDLAERTERFKQLKAQAWTEYLTLKGKPDEGLYPYVEKRVSEAFGKQLDNQSLGNLTPQQQNRLEELRSKNRRKKAGQ